MRSLQATEKNLSNSSRFTIFDSRYYLRKFLKNYPRFNKYEGIDAVGYRYVTIYLKKVAKELTQNSESFNISNKIKGEIRRKVAPHVLWEGIFKRDSSIYNVQIHQKYGPSLRQMFQCVKEPISVRDLFHFMYQLMKLIEKINSVGFVFRQINLDEIVFDSRPEKCDLYFANAFPLRKKGEEAPQLHGRFCSIGAHLGRRASYRDDLESICYISLYIFTQGKFLSNVNSKEWINEKSKINFDDLGREIPELLKEFYYYVLNLNYTDEVSFYTWRSKLYNLLGKQTILKPYEWMKSKNKTIEKQTTDQSQQNKKIERTFIEDELDEFDEDEEPVWELMKKKSFSPIRR